MKNSTFNLPVEYGNLTSQERRMVREQYVVVQKGYCHYCGGPLGRVPSEEITSKTIYWKAFPPNFLRYPVHLHHDHGTGLTIGAVHAYCNAVLWQYHGE